MSDQPATPPAETPPAEEAGLPEIKIDDFLKIDLRVVTVKEAADHPNADKLLVLKLDDGTAEGRQVCAGLRGRVDPADLVGKQIVIVANLAPRKMRGEISQGMLLAAGDDEGIAILNPSQPVAAGTQVG
jgi:methionyl-tRNA synthetase